MATPYNIPGRSKNTGARQVNLYGRKSSGKRSETGPGYETDRGDSRYQFKIIIDHGNTDKMLAQAQRDMANFAKNMNTILASPIQAEVAQMKIGYVPRPNSELKTFGSRFQFGMASKKLDESIYKNFASDIGRLGVSEVRDGIRHPDNAPTGPRYDTGTMYNKVAFRKDKRAHSTVVSIGWVRTFYKYFDFQERGTATLGAMNAIKNGYRSTNPKAANLMSRFLANYTNSGGFNGGYRR
jgi:hypothetical protein